MAHEHLIGHVAFIDTVNHILLQSGCELYADGTKAIVWLSNPEKPDLNQRLVFRRPQMVITIVILICAWREVQGVIDLGKERIPDVETVLCPYCGGTGWFDDRDGNQLDCEMCEGRGYTEESLKETN